MSPSQASSDFPRLTGAANFDVWKTRVRAALDGKNQLGFIDKRDYDGTSDGEDTEAPGDEDEDMSGFSDFEDEGTSLSLEERTGSMQLEDPSILPDDEESKADEPPVIQPFAASKAATPAPKRAKTAKAAIKPRSRLTMSEIRRADARVKSLLMKTLDDKHILMVKSHDKSFDIYQTICKKYEGTTASGDPYVIMAFLFNARYEEGNDLTEFLIRYERAIESLNLALGNVLGASVSSVFLYNAMPKAWENEMRIWRSTRNIIPYEELKTNLEAYVTNKLAQERFALSRGTPESKSTSNEKALVVSNGNAPPVALIGEKLSTCTYCSRTNHVMQDCRTLVRHLQVGQVKPGTVLPANYKLPANSSSNGDGRQGRGQRSHPYNRGGRGSGGRNSGGGRGYGRQGGRGYHNNGGYQGGGNYHNNGGFQNSNSYQSDQQGGNYDQGRHESAMIALTVPDIQPVSLAASATPATDSTWTVDSGCTRHVTYTDAWFTSKTPYTGSITVGGKNQIPILAVGEISLQVSDTKGAEKTLTLKNVLYAPQLKFNLLSVPAAVRDDFHFAFKRTQCIINTSQHFSIKALMKDDSGLYQFSANPPSKIDTAVVAMNGTAKN